MTTLALDPSLSCTGYAALSGRTLDESRVIECGTAKPKADDLFDRLWEIEADCLGLLVKFQPTTVVVERPMDKSFGLIGARGRISAPNYGMAVWCVYRVACEQVGRENIRTPTPAEWVGRGSIPSSQGDKYKEKRVRWVETLYPEWRGRLGPKTTAGNIADAILLARWSIGMGAFGRMIGAAGDRRSA
ncbi:MAG: hypothetical protein IT438_16355 [Phycisphaerales bacterium]|nr:hypothetical protein [Phycisphaerales bacterium]